MIMLSAIFVALITQGKGLPDSYIGLYADRNDRAFVVTSGSTMEYIEGDMWGDVAGIYAAPNRDLVATWMQSRTITTLSPDHWVVFDKNGRWKETPWYKAQDAAYKPFKVPVLGVMQPDNVRYTGEFRLKFLGNSAFSLVLNDSKGTTYLSTSLFYIGGYEAIRVGGVYKDRYTDLNITEVWGRGHWDVTGTFSHMGKKFNIEGERLYTRGRLNLIDPTTGRTVGQCIYGFMPTKAQMKEFKNGTIEPCDSLLLNFVVPGSPTIQIKGVSR